MISRPYESVTIVPSGCEGAKRDDRLLVNITNGQPK